MTQKSQPLPGMGGSYLRKKDGTLVPRQAEAEPAPAIPETPAAPEPEPVQDKPAMKSAKPTAKDA